MRMFEWQRRWSGADSDSRGLGSWHMTANCQRCRRFLLLCRTQVWKRPEKCCNKETTLISWHEAAHTMPFSYREEVLSLKVAQWNGGGGGCSEKLDSYCQDSWLVCPWPSGRRSRPPGGSLKGRQPHWCVHIIHHSPGRKVRSDT